MSLPIPQRQRSIEQQPNLLPRVDVRLRCWATSGPKRLAGDEGLRTPLRQEAAEATQEVVASKPGVWSARLAGREPSYGECLVYGPRHERSLLGKAVERSELGQQRLVGRSAGLECGGEVRELGGQRSTE